MMSFTRPPTILFALATLGTAITTAVLHGQAELRIRQILGFG